MQGELIMYFGACGVCGIHLPGRHGLDALAGAGSFPESMSISLSLKVPSANNLERRSGGGSKVGHLEPSLVLPFAIIIIFN
jgi:hypothetical protein